MLNFLSFELMCTVGRIRPWYLFVNKVEVWGRSRCHCLCDVTIAVLTTTCFCVQLLLTARKNNLEVIALPRVLWCRVSSVLYIPLVPSAFVNRDPLLARTDHVLTKTLRSLHYHILCDITVPALSTTCFCM